MKPLKTMVWKYKYNVKPPEGTRRKALALLEIEDIYYDLRAQIIETDAHDYTLEDWTNGLGGI